MATPVELDGETRAELRRRATSLTLPYRVVVRAKLVLLAADGRTNREIAERVDMSADRVGDWRRRFHEEGLEGLKGGIEQFDRLVKQVMTKEPYASARRVFWVVDNGSDHRGQRSIDRLQGRWRNLILVHLPVHASWLNQVEIYHSILQRKLLDPNDFASTAELARALNDVEHRYNEIAEPFEWSFTRQDLARLIARLTAGEGGQRPRLKLAA